MKINELLSLREKLTFEDILIEPGWSNCKSRTENKKEISTQLLIMSANMKSVTDINLAKQMGTLHQLGVIPRDVTIPLANWRYTAISVGLDFKVDRELIFNKFNLLDSKYWPRFVFLEVANAANQWVFEATQKLLELCPAPVIVGNLATAMAVRKYGELRKKFPNLYGVKVGLGPGSACTTRLVTGVGVPQLSAVASCAEAAKLYGLKIIADGGIEKPGDFVKAIAVGADHVMMGKVLAYAVESPGWVKVPTGPYDIEEMFIPSGFTWSKPMRGSAADGDFIEGGVITLTEQKRKNVCDIIDDYMDGLASAMSYVGATNIEEFREMVEFQLVRGSAVRENGLRA